MKLLFPLLFISCSNLNVGDYTHSISKIQTCWQQGKVSCIEQHFGKPDEIGDDYIAYRNKTLRISKQGDKISTIAYWLLDPKNANEKTIKALLESNDWKVELLPEKNAHVVNLAEANFSKKLGASFLTYKLDPDKKVKVLYWGGDHRDIEL